MKRLYKELKASVDFLVSDDLSDQDIEEMEKRIERDVAKRQGELEERSEEIAETKEKVEQQNLKMNIVTAQLGEMTAKKKVHESNQDGFEQMVKEVAEELGWEDQEEDLEQSGTRLSQNEEATDRVLDKMKRSLNEKNADLRKITMEMEAKIEAQSKEISEQEKNKALLEDQKKRATTSMIESKKEIAVIKSKLRLNEEAAERLADIEKKMNKKADELKGVRSSVNLDDLRATISSKAKELLKNEKRELELKEEKATLDQYQRVISDINSKRQECEEKQERLDMLMSKRRRQLGEIFDNSATPEVRDLKDEFNLVMDRLAESKQGLEKAVIQSRSSIDVKKDKRKQLLAEVSERQAKISGFQEELGDLVDAEEETALEDVLETTKEEVEAARMELQVKEANRFTFDEYIKSLELGGKRNQHACPTCNRGFKSSREAEELKSDLRDQIKKIPSKVQSIKSRLVKLTEKQDRLRDLLPEKKRVDEFKKEVETKSKAVKAFERELKSLEKETEANDLELETVSSKFGTCEELRQDIFNIDILNKDIGDLNDKLGDLQRNNVKLDNVRSLEDFKKEDDTVSRKLTALRKEIDLKKNREIEVERNINRLEKELNICNQDKLEIEKHQQEAAALKDKMASLEVNVEEQVKEQKRVEGELSGIRDELDNLKRKKNKLVFEKQKEIEAKGKIAEHVRDMSQRLENLVNEIRAYDGSNNEEKYANVLKKIGELRDAKAKNEGLIKKLEADKLKTEKFVKEHVKQQADIKDNLKLRLRPES